MNRYSYVQGNPVSLIDPFGTRPLTAKEQAVHSILGLLGAIPGLGAIPDLINAFIYVEQGHYGSAIVSLACALSTIADVAAKGVKLADSGSDLAKVISEVRRYAKTIEGLDSVLSGLDNLYTDHIVEGKEISGNTIWNIISITAGLGKVIGVNMSAKQKQALYDAVAGAKEGVDKAAKKFVENIKKGASDFHNNNGGFVNPHWNKVDDIQESGSKLNKVEDVINNVDKANPYDLNPTHGRTLSSKEMNDLINNIKKNGINETIKYVEYNGQKYVVDGHHRLIAAKRLGLKQVPIERVELPYAGYKTIEDLLWY